MSDTASGRAQFSAGPARRLTVSLSLLLACIIAAAIFISNGIVMWQGWQAAHRAMLHSAEEMAVNMSQTVDERVRRTITAAGSTIHRLTFDTLRIKTDLYTRMPRLLRYLNPPQNMPLLSAVYTAYTDGEKILIRPLKTDEERAANNAPTGAIYLVQVKEAGGNNKTSQQLFYNKNYVLLQKRTIPSPDYDATTRPWFQAAMQAGGPQLSAPYVFFGNQQAGITISERAQDGLSVIGLDIELSTLDEQLHDMQPTPNSEIAIVTTNGRVLAYTGAASQLQAEDGMIQLPTLKSLDVPALQDLAKMNLPSSERVAGFNVRGQEWYGLKAPLTSIGTHKLELLVAIPDSDLLQQVRQDFMSQSLWAVAAALLLMLGGWFVGRHIGQKLSRLTTQAQRLAHFDFSAPPQGGSSIQELEMLSDVLRRMSETIRNFLTTVDAIGNEAQLDVMLKQVLQQTVHATDCTAGAVYLLNANNDGLRLAAMAGQQMVREDGSAACAEDTPFCHDTLSLSVLTPPHPPVGLRRAGEGQIAIPLSDRQNKPLGLLLLNYSNDERHRGMAFRAFATQISGALSAAIETRQLVDAQRDLFEGFVHLIADAIDAKSPYTGGHCRRVPELAINFVNRMNAEGHSPYGPYELSADERHAFHLGAWLHDCGKVTSPEHIIDKATKLEAIHNRIHEVRTRFEVLWRDAQIAHLQRLQQGEDAAASEARMQEEQAHLQEEFAFLAQCNIGGEFMSDEAIARVQALSQRTWTRHFSNRLGLSREEEARMSDTPEPPLPVQENLLIDRPDQQLQWGPKPPPVTRDDPANHYGFDMQRPSLKGNLGEVHNLTVRRGTLTEEERFHINDHVTQTYIMLKALPWPEPLRRVPEIAATHHERMDGKGYPRRLDANFLTLEDRVMAIADIFEALTASDRPYKTAKRLSESLRIMSFMARDGHLDPLLMRYFLEHQVWADYAARFMRPEQCDDVDLDALLALLPRSAPPPLPPEADTALTPAPEQQLAFA
ncbi:HD domain-containing phosphohydrolase [Xanthobacter sp. TB0139]|uniref:HD domain-containing phosphohydrolase n=1 Tax=Xanthobacter sp. TB0139 TaxID=3459178 RepID=UPI004039FB8B